MKYFSDRELGEQPRNKSEIPPAVWNGLSSLIQRKIDDSSFGVAFPERCPDSPHDPAVCCGMDNHQFADAMRAEIPAFSEVREVWEIRNSDMPDMMAMFDLLEFCWVSIGKPIAGGPHSYYRHHHLTFDKGVGQSEFKDDVNRIFSRNGLAYTMNEQGMIERIVPAIAGNALSQAVFYTGDADLDELLETARKKFLSPDEIEHRDALEKLWDAWERVKTLDANDKKVGAKKMLDDSAGFSQPRFRELLEAEARNLTRAGNQLRIRHSEMDQERLTKPEQVDYLFYRMFALMDLILKSKRSSASD